mmetsp:Transcript_16511/g.35587  ORF Transcript_16511/g.35587 Transcript_16511/m.35587 type:complete len:444 (+) Transcript_16511:118-1449(+)
MSEAQALVERYRGANEQGSSQNEQIRADVLRSSAPDWSHFSTSAYAAALSTLDVSASAEKKKAAFEAKPSLVEGVLAAANVTEENSPGRWAMTAVCDMLREDSSCFGIFDDALHKGVSLYKPLLKAATAANADQYVADKAAWLLTAIMGNVPFFFTTDEAVDLVKSLQSGSSLSDLGKLEAIVNLMKTDQFRAAVWKVPGVSEVITTVSAQGAPPFLYKCVFAMWLLSFEDGSNVSLPIETLVGKIRQILAVSRVEKVIRLSLTVLKNYLTKKAFAVEVVEQGLLEIVQQLEYEKWRDTELYDDIRELASQISLRVTDMSSFERYEKELNEGTLKWGFIHSSKFWADNVLKFEQNDFRALKLLVGLLGSGDPTTLAVACHDIGEFVTCHPLGKKQVANMNVKDRVMLLMGSTNPDHREVRREALLCCQKIMLNKWQDLDTIPK